MFEASKVRASTVIKDLTALRDDAAAAGMVDPARHLEEASRGLKDAALKIQTKIESRKADLGLFSKASFAGKNSDLKPPKFSGDASDKLDYYQFYRDFKEYCSTRAPSKMEELRILKHNCLEGMAKSLCENKTSTEEIWKSLPPISAVDRRVSFAFFPPADLPQKSA